MQFQNTALFMTDDRWR